MGHMRCVPIYFYLSVFLLFYLRCLGPIARHAVDLVPMLKAICQISVDKLHLDEDVSKRSCVTATASA